MGYLFPIVAALAGTGLQMAGASQTRRAEDAAMSAELARQRRYQSDAQQVASQNVAASAPKQAQKAIDTGAQKYAQEYQKVQAIPLSASAVPITYRNAANNALSVEQRNALDNAASARLGGYSEWDLQQAIKNLQAQEQLGLINNFSRGSSGVLNAELQNASHSGDTLAGVGGLVGNLGTLYGLSSLAKTPTSAQSAMTYAGTGQAMVPSLGSGQSMYANMLYKMPATAQYFNFGLK